MLDQLPDDIRKAVIALLEKDFQLAKEVCDRYFARHPELLKELKKKKTSDRIEVVVEDNPLDSAEKFSDKV